MEAERFARKNRVLRIITRDSNVLPIRATADNNPRNTTCRSRLKLSRPKKVRTESTRFPVCAEPSPVIERELITPMRRTPNRSKKARKRVRPITKTRSL
jgi:hypothetical protein